MGGLISGFASLSDIIGYTLPTALAFYLFIPYLSDNPDFLVVLAVVTGYIATSMVANIYLSLPFLRSKESKQTESLKKIQSRWKLRKLFIALDVNDKDEIRRVDAYRIFYIATSAYLFLYTLANLVLVVINGVYATSPLFGFGRVPASIIVLVSGFISWQAQEKYFGSGTALNALYESLAKIYHKRGYGIATGVWGQVHHCGDLCVDTKIRLISGSLTRETSLDSKGGFLLENCFDNIVDQPSYIEIACSCETKQFEFMLHKNQIPEIIINI